MRCPLRPILQSSPLPMTTVIRCSSAHAATTLRYFQTFRTILHECVANRMPTLLCPRPEILITLLLHEWRACPGHSFCRHFEILNSLYHLIARTGYPRQPHTRCEIMSCSPLCWLRLRRLELATNVHVFSVSSFLQNHSLCCCSRCFNPAHACITPTTLYPQPVVRMLLSWGCNPHEADQWGATPLHLACSTSSRDNTAILDMLLEYSSSGTIEEGRKICSLTPDLDAVHVLCVDNRVSAWLCTSTCHFVVVLRFIYSSWSHLCRASMCIFRVSTAVF